MQAIGKATFGPSAPESGSTPEPDERPDDRAPGLGGPVGAMHAELEARLSGGEYEGWLLPVEPRDPHERLVHFLSLGAGVVALTGAGALLWFTMLSPALG